MLNQSEMWEAVRRRDRSADGQFVFAVRSTGIYCRPGCPARTPKPANMRYFLTADAAEAAGFRACRRCDPRGPGDAARHAALVAAACRTIDTAEEPPALATLAASAGISPYHFHRLFKATTGLTPRDYARAQRDARVRAALAGGASVTAAIYEAGFGASSRFYEGASHRLGMNARAYRDGGRGETVRWAIGQSTLGPVLVAATTRGIAAIEFGESPEALVAGLHARFPRATIAAADPAFAALLADVMATIEQPAASPALPLDIRGTAFQHRVWQALRAVPPGQTVSYAELARRIDAPGAVRAVASACAANPLAVAIPCHRAVRQDGGLAGYRWGLDRKRTLLEREAALTASSGKPAAPALR